MFTRFLAVILASSLLLQVGMQAYTLGWFALNNQSFTEKFCQNWEEDIPMCFGSCKVADAFVSSDPVQEQLVPTQSAPQQSSVYLLASRARPQDAMLVEKQRRTSPPAYPSVFYTHNYVGSVFWPPAT